MAKLKPVPKAIAGVLIVVGAYFGGSKLLNSGMLKHAVAEAPAQTTEEAPAVVEQAQPVAQPDQTIPQAPQQAAPVMPEPATNDAGMNKLLQAGQK